MTLAHWKTIKWATHLAAMGVAVHAVNEGADPLITMMIVAVLLGGPDVLEYLAVAQDFQDFREGRDNDE